MNMTYEKFEQVHKALTQSTSKITTFSSYGNLREVIRKTRYCEKFFDVVPLKRCGKGQVEFARDRLVRKVDRLGVVRRNGRSRKVGLALVLMVPTEGQREERGRDVRVGLRKPAEGVGRT